MHGLVIKSPWIEYILDGTKTWEIRGSRTNIRGEIALCKSGTGLVLGTVQLFDCLGPLTQQDMVANVDKHMIDPSVMPYPETYAWVVTRPQRLAIPKKYQHPPGAVIWVKRVTL